ncbi:fungal-specific transcription factor domain-containing protein [Phyllosticta citrichinensis]|uniref:Fungal-specific transcription factor domain-containing protein n=1 Tax=Phyllosticta citrichinensis TaxID=1130410 RepID=A0ABR1XW24_9PEZI
MVRTHKKRTKTFNGCWTCRERGVKCDLAKPTCERCSKSGRECKGYGLRLVWLDANDTLPNVAYPTRRLISEADRQNPMYPDDFLDDALARLETLESPCESIIGPFGVFSVPGSTDKDDDIQMLVRSDYDHQPTALNLSVLSTTAQFPFRHLHRHGPSPNQDSSLYFNVGAYDPRRYEYAPSLPMEINPAMLFTNESERSLFHHYTFNLARMLVPITSTDNPFQNVCIPLVLQPGGVLTSRPGHAALLHGIYAISAYHVAEQASEQSLIDNYARLAVRHYGKCLGNLRQSLQDIRLDSESVFATILLLGAIGWIVGHPTDWRVHMHGARSWLRAQGPGWGSSGSAAVLYQMFRCVELLNFSQDSRRLIDANHDSHINLLDCGSPLPAEIDYRMDAMFGVPRALFESLRMMHILRDRETPPTEHELQEVEAMIECAKDEVAGIQVWQGMEKLLLTHHSMSFYYACHINLNREFRKLPASEVQHWVLASAQHLEAVYAIEEKLQTCGVSWPIWITACEAEGEELRRRALFLFTKGVRLGVGVLNQMAEVIQKIWEHRDLTGDTSTECRRAIMMAMGMDLQLA